jgi:methionyl aminopeptidase
MGIEIKSDKEIAEVRHAGHIVAEILKIMAKQIKPGMKTKELDIIAQNELKSHGAESSFKGYRGYPATVCVSINDEIVHGIPGDRVLQNGDVVALDFGAIYHGFQATPR